VLRNEGEPHVASLAKKAAAFLRNTLGRGRGRQGVSKCLGSALEVGEHATAVSLFICCGPGITIGHAEAQGIVKEDRDLASSCGNSFLLADPCCETSVECTERRITSSYRDGRQPQQCCCPAGRSARPR